MLLIGVTISLPSLILYPSNLHVTQHLQILLYRLRSQLHKRYCFDLAITKSEPVPLPW